MAGGRVCGACVGEGRVCSRVGGRRAQNEGETRQGGRILPY